MQQHALTTSTALSRPNPLWCPPLRPARRAAPRSALMWRKCARSIAHASAISMLCRSVTEEALVSTYVNGTLVYLDAKSAHRLTARCSKCHVFFGNKACWSSDNGPLDSWLKSTNRDSHPGAFSFDTKLGYWPGWSLLLGCNHTPMRRCRWMLLPSVSRLGYSKR